MEDQKVAANKFKLVQCRQNLANAYRVIGTTKLGTTIMFTAQKELAEDEFQMLLNWFLLPDETTWVLRLRPKAYKDLIDRMRAFGGVERTIERIENPEKKDFETVTKYANKN